MEFLEIYLKANLTESEAPIKFLRDLAVINVISSCICYQNLLFEASHAWFVYVVFVLFLSVHPSTDWQLFEEEHI